MARMSAAVRLAGLLIGLAPACAEKVCQGEYCSCVSDQDCEILNCYVPSVTSSEDCVAPCDCTDGEPVSTKRLDEWWSARREHCNSDYCAVPSCATVDCSAEASKSLRAECRFGTCVAVQESQ